MKRILLGATAALALAGAASAQSLFVGEAGPNRGARAEALQWFADQAEELTDGDLSLDIQWGGALFKANAAVSGIRDGIADMGTIIAVYFPQEMVAYNIADLPLQNPDAWVGMKATDELMRNSDAIAQNLADQNLVYLGTFTTSAVHVGCKGATIRSVDDISGLKVRGVGAYGDTFREFGANMVPMSIYDAYQALDTGLIDCSQGYSYATAALKQQEVIDSYTLMNWGQVGALGIFANKDVFDGLEPEVQEALLTAGEGMADELGRLITADNEAAIETMREAGVEIIELPDEERQKLVETSTQFIDEWKDRAGQAGLDADALLEEYRGLIDKYTQIRDEEGYPWEDGQG
ncbi:TRAP family 2,3-diketo-L-gulonate transporter periplasmic 2,3-diketo-L-gulonate-binding protein [Roseivivax marinus]|jgi:TRAP-type C4-dicarboxylate transport system substrate-binding protein|uniref:TRAP family 2,3-diketo-L-gulonate transporter periplasmic 2,3-diketo-L-gulonate-binding protein n=1 Tax=Roseivivax marinus TaxID=1379903 RepID=W4HJN2_9RHOB|nr:C4-dicarboxylate TRAP transporter substrate-binding protein [Roseivivax marinus]ETW12927.1 TRAP family 2,3-diketo-L-gulonate transporter periplasmic 2,3-diketo-L-gulonate-binding protein [Roseivivax marinus]UMA64515.1 C4-dicarboxylate TRAP transporter substrate-binding protein [Roseivivax marinus]SEL54540.1 TRAP-type C4-dicarboxylate transport system, substrate-binding protein [Roseivivax marinus]